LLIAEEEELVKGAFLGEADRGRYKLELLDNADGPSCSPTSRWRTFIDPMRGPHLARNSEDRYKAFKLDEPRAAHCALVTEHKQGQGLTRIYGNLRYNSQAAGSSTGVPRSGLGGGAQRARSTADRRTSYDLFHFGREQSHGMSYLAPDNRAPHGGLEPFSRTWGGASAEKAAAG